MKNLYTSELTKNKYDSIIIGSGVGGLTTAVCLAKSGKKVLVLEKHYVAGGFSHTFKRKKFEWDVGAHYIGQVNNPNSLIRKAFDYITNSKLQWEDMGDIYDQAIIEGETYNFKKGLQNQINQMNQKIRQKTTGKCQHTGQVNSIDNQRVIYQNT